MIKDRFRFRKELHSKQKRPRLASRIEQSVQLADARREAVPRIEFPETLPITARADDIGKAIAANQVVIIAGETGSGKTTQIPKICLGIGRGVYGMIGHTQPRRVAARTVAHRIAEELGVNVGEQVGFQVRFTDQSAPGTHVKIMTDGILLAETQQDRFLEAYDTIIIDEAHERSLNIDFLLGYLKRILPKRPDLKVIVTSATIDVERFSKHFDAAPVIEVSGRTYPVEVLYRPLDEGSNSRDSDELLYQGVLDALGEIDSLQRKHKGARDVLVFLSGEQEIRELAHLIRRSEAGFEVLPLYSRLGVAEQNRVFQPHQGRRVILATNVAETSLTVPGIGYVIDPGFARISRYSVRSKVQQLPIEPISRASAEQRKGRCGRISAGVCVRLYSEEDFLSRPEFMSPEILRTNLAAVILQMLSLRLGDMSKFPFVERPDQRQINDGFHLLMELKAVDGKRAITRLGREMTRFPVDLRLARMLLEAGKKGCLSEVLTIVSAIAIQDPRERPHDHQQAADEKHRRHWHEQSDFMALVNLWNFFEDSRQELTQNQLRRFCHENFLSFLRMREWKDNHRQLRLICKEMGMRENREAADYASIHRALLAGLLGNIGERVDEGEYLGARNRKHYIHPGSSQFKRKPRWIVSAELVETTRLFGRTVAQIDSEWVEPLAGHLVKRNYHEPFFDPERGQVFAHEEVMLYGISIIKRRRIDFGAVDPVRARQIFIQFGLVEQQLASNAGFYQHNARMIAEVENLESKSRKRDILVDSFTLYRFYDERLPANVLSEIDLDIWRKVAERSQPKLLYLRKEDLMRQEPALSASLYPDTLEVANTTLNLDYHFDPQHEHDGVSIKVPVAILRQVDEARLDWVIPGLLREKCLALIKSLPKALRRNFVPAPEYADRVLAAGLDYDGRPLHVVLAERLFRLTGVNVAADQFDIESIEKHLRMNIKVIGDDGELLDSSRNLEALVEKYAGQVDREFKRRAKHQVEVQAATDWQFGEIPDYVELEQSGVKLRGYPTIVDKGDSVAVEVVDNEVTATQLGREGLLRLLMLQLNDQKKYLEKNFPGFSRFSIYFATQGSREELLANLVEAVFRYTFIDDLPAVRTEAEFRERLENKQRLISNANMVAELVEQILPQRTEIERLLAQMQTDLNRHACADMRRQLDSLLAPGFISTTTVAWLRHYPRYLAAIRYRIDKMRGNLARDKESTAEIHKYQDRYESLDVSGLNEDLRSFRWMLEEYRVSLFAQPLGTSIPVSGKRLEKEWQRAVGLRKVEKR